MTATISPEEDYTVPEDPGVIFTCTVNTIIMQWLVNNTFAGNPAIVRKNITRSSIVEIGKSGYSSLLFIPATIAISNTSVQCRAYDISNTNISCARSKLIFLHIQELPAPPPNLTLTGVTTVLTVLPIATETG